MKTHQMFQVISVFCKCGDWRIWNKWHCEEEAWWSLIRQMFFPCLISVVRSTGIKTANSWACNVFIHRQKW